MDFDIWWNSAAADAFRAANEDMSGEVVRPIWDAAVLSASPAAPEAARPAEFCWLVEQFYDNATNKNSTGLYWTGFEDDGHQSETTHVADLAFKITAKGVAERFAKERNDKQKTRGVVWKAVEHGFDAIAMPCDKPPSGWNCNGCRDHEGPCAAIPVPTDAVKPEQQAQAGEPNGDTIREIARKVRNLNGPSDTTSPEQYVAGGWLAAMQFHGPAITKKDAALQACLVHMLIAYGQNSHDMILTGDELRGLHAAIIQAEEARK